MLMVSFSIAEASPATAQRLSQFNPSTQGPPITHPGLLGKEEPNNIILSNRVLYEGTANSTANRVLLIGYP